MQYELHVLGKKGKDKREGERERGAKAPEQAGSVVCGRLRHQVSCSSACGDVSFLTRDGTGAPALEARFLTMGPLGKSLKHSLLNLPCSFCCFCCKNYCFRLVQGFREGSRVVGKQNKTKLHRGWREKLQAETLTPEGLSKVAGLQRLLVVA